MANIDFGQVDRYDEERGFGFVSRNFTDIYSGGVFFHIKTAKRTSAKLAKALRSFDHYDAPYCWYEFEKTAKGAQVSSFIDPAIIEKQYTAESIKIIESIKNLWLDEDKSLNILGQFPPLPKAIIEAASEILPKNELIRLGEKRAALEARKNLVWKEQKRIEEIKRKEMEDKKSTQNKIEEEEFLQLVAEISRMDFTHSKQVSDYIVRNALGLKYKNISGVLQMQMRGTAWSFNGGFPRNIYARLCSELGLENQGSEAKPGEFRSYKELYGEQ